LIQDFPDTAPDACRRPGSRAPGLHQVRTGKGLVRNPHYFPACRQESDDSCRDDRRPGIRFAHRIFSGDRKHFCLAGHGQADHRFDQYAGPPRHRCLSDDDGVPVRRAEFRGGYLLRTSGSPGQTRFQGLIMDISQTVDAPPPEPPRYRVQITNFMRSPVAVTGLVVLMCVILVAIFAPQLSPQNPYDLMQLDIMDARLPPGSKNFDGVPYVLGTDSQGRDIPPGIFYGLRTSLMFGGLSAVAAALIGTTFGLIAAYVGG